MKRWLGLDSFFLFFLRKLLFIWVRTHRLPQDFSTLGIDPQRPVVYALQDKSFSNLLVVEHECLKLGLPRPTRPSGIRGTGGDRRFFCLTKNDGLFFGRYRLPYISQRIERLVSAGRAEGAPDVQIVPVSVYWGRRPEKERSLIRILLSDTWSASGLIKKMFMILVNGRQTYVQFSQPVMLKELLAEGLGEERTARKLGRVLRVHFRREREAMIGPDLSHRRTLIDTLIAAPAVKEAIRQDATEKKRTVEESTEAAWEYANEIASDYSHTVIRFLERLLNWVWNRLYAGLEINHVEKLTAVARTHEIVYVPCHRSHIDYLLLSFLVYRHGMVPPHIAAGINLNMPVVGPILRRGGAFFMRRSFKGNPLYSTVFNEYLHSMFARGFSVEYFIEGGRSRTGRMLQPRTGMLAMTVRSFLRDTARPIAFVPVYIGYERVLESGSYVEELHGKQKKKESLGGVFETAARLFGRTGKLSDRFGKVHVNFGDPLDLGTFLDTYAPDGWRTAAPADEATAAWLAPLIEKLARNINRRINDAAAVNPVNLLSLALLATPKRVMDEESLRNMLALYQRLLADMHYGPNVTVTTLTPEEIIAHGEKMKILQRYRHSLGDLLWLDDAASVTLTYFRNNVLHLFALPSLVANLLLRNRSLSREQLVALVRVIHVPLRAELFLHHGPRSVISFIDQVIDALDKAGLIEKAADGSLQAPATGTLEHAQLSVLAQTIRETLERYYIVISLVMTHAGSIDEAQLEKLSQLVAQRMAILYTFNSPEFFDAQVIKRFIRTMKREGLFTADADGRIGFSEQLVSIEADTRRILSAEIRRNIAQHTRLDLSALPAPEKKKRKG
ncbi:MAG: glycerol-3-phosphate 1-O-acyltransferase PlsB [Pseudomonadota bacterium]